MKKLWNKSITLYLSLLVGFSMLASPAICSDNWQRIFPAYPTHGFNDIYAQSVNNAFAVGNSGLISHYNGSVWSEMESPVAVDLRAIWGRAANNIFAVGNEGTILWYNGSTWKKMSSTTNADLYCVWGFDENDSLVYAGGRNGEILMYSGGTWANMDTPVNDGIWKASIIYDIWGESPTNLYAVGWGTDNSTVFDIFLTNSGGNSWAENTSLVVSGYLRPESVLGFSGGNVYIGGHNGVYQLANGDFNQSSNILLSTDTYDIWGSSQASIWFVGGVMDAGGSLIHYNGHSSTTLATTTLQQFSQSTGISGISDTDIFISGDHGLILHAQLNPDTQKGMPYSMTSIPDSSVESICGTSSDTLYGVGADGMILSFDGNDWTPMQSQTNEQLNAICGTSNAMFTVGEEGTVLFYNGSVWSTVTSGTTEYLRDVWCLAGNTAYVVGDNGTILLCNGTTCSTQTTDGTTTDLSAVYHSDLGSFAAGEFGVVMQKDNNTWTQITPVPAANDITDLWGDANAGVLVTVGGRYVHSYNVTNPAWTEKYVSNYSSQHLMAVTGTQSSDLYVVGYGSDNTAPYNDGIVLYSNGGSFSEIKSFADQDLRSVWLVSGELFVGTASPDSFSRAGVNAILYYNGSQWLGMAEKRIISSEPSGSSPDDLYVAGSNGLIMHYDGSSWLSMDSGSLEDLYAVYGAPNGQWALAATFDKLLRYNGSTWSQVFSPTGNSFSDFWGSGEKVFVVGDDIILTSNNSGLNWQEASIPANTSYLLSIWGAGIDGPFFASGNSATLLTSDTGGIWTSMQGNNQSFGLSLHALWGSSATDVYAAGDTFGTFDNESEILHYDGTAWESVLYNYNYLPPQYISALWGRSQTDVFAFGSQTLRNDECSTSWEKINIPGVPPLEKVWGMEGNDGLYYIFGVADSGREIYQYTSSSNRSCSSPSPWALFLPAIISNHQ